MCYNWWRRTTRLSACTSRTTISTRFWTESASFVRFSVVWSASFPTSSFPPTAAVSVSRLFVSVGSGIAVAHQPTRKVNILFTDEFHLQHQLEGRLSPRFPRIHLFRGKSFKLLRRYAAVLTRDIKLHCDRIQLFDCSLVALYRKKLWIYSFYSSYFTNYKTYCHLRQKWLWFFINKFFNRSSEIN